MLIIEYCYDLAGSEVLNNQRDMTASRAITAVLSNGAAAAEYNTQYEEGGDNSQYDEGDNPSEKDDDEVSIDVETASEVSINTVSYVCLLSPLFTSYKRGG